MTAALVIVLLWVAFGATHMGLSSRRLRPRLVAALGAGGFAGVPERQLLVGPGGF